MAAPVGQTASQGTPATGSAVAPVPRDTSVWGGLKPTDLTNLTAEAILEGVGITRPNATQMRMMVAWINSEQRDFLHVNDNPLNTTLGAAGSIGSMNTAGVRVYDTLAHGVAADVSTLGHYPNIVNALKASNPSAFFSAVGSSSWGTPSSLLSGAYAAVDPSTVKSVASMDTPLKLHQAPATELLDAANPSGNDLGKIPVVGGALSTGYGLLSSAGSVLDAVKAIGSFLTDTHNYLRVGESALGGLLLIGGIWSLLKGRSGLALVLGIGGYVFLYGGVKDVRPIDEVKAAFGG